jgi:ribulose bisphosphate carboxylase large subunit-like protein
MGDRLVATFELEPPGSAQALAVEESTGTEAIPAEMWSRVGGEVLSDERGRAVIAWPWRNWGANLPQLMASVLVGEGCETARFTRCRLVAIEWPDELVAALGGGPRLGLDGVRARLGPGAETRPLLGGIVKPSLGLGPGEVAATAAALARGGCDLIKDDELLADPDWCPLAERVPAVAAALAGIGRPVLYAANISGPVDTLLDRAAAAVDAGATAIMVNAFATGIDAVRAVAAAGLGVPVLAHRVGAGPIVRNPEVGVDGAVLCELTRIAGADLVQIGGFGGKLFDTHDEVARNLAAGRWAVPGCPSPSTAAACGPVRPPPSWRPPATTSCSYSAWAPTSTPAAPKPAPAACARRSRLSPAERPWRPPPVQPPNWPPPSPISADAEVASPRPARPVAWPPALFTGAESGDSHHFPRVWRSVGHRFSPCHARMRGWRPTIRFPERSSGGTGPSG